MIARLSGTVVEKLGHALIVDVGGVGYEVLVPRPDYDNVLLDKPVMLYTYFHVRENSQELFGFSSIAAKDFFQTLIGINGVGPKMALSILSLGDEKQVKSAIASEDVRFLTGAPGVGKRVAERLVVELRDKLGVIAGGGVSAAANYDDAHNALVALGYNPAQASQALAGVDRTKTIEERIKLALKELSR